MSNNNGDMPANPILNDWEGFTAFIDGTKGGRNYGLTKREHFAARAMQGIFANSDITGVLAELQSKGKGGLDHLVARMAVENADALLQALENNHDES